MPPSTMLSAALPWLLGFLFLFAIDNARAQAPTVSIEATLVSAQASKAPVQKEIKHLKPFLDATFPARFGNYSLMGKDTAIIQAGKSQKLDIGGGYIADILVTEILKDKVKLQVIWKNPKNLMLSNIKLTVTENRPFIVAGPKTELGTLIMLVKSK